jgi:hypothetical protein
MSFQKGSVLEAGKVMVIWEGFSKLGKKELALLVK